MSTIARTARAMRFAIAAAGTAIAAFATTQLAGLIRQNLAAAGTLQRVAEVVSFNVEQLQELRFAAEQMNIAQRQVDLGLQRFSRRIAEAAEGQGELLSITDRYGVQLRQFVGGPMRESNDILADFADLIKNASSEQEQLRIAFKLFDSEGASLVRLLRLGSAGMQEFRDRARDAGVVLDESLINRAAEADRVLNEVSQTIRSDVLRAVAENAEEMGKIGQLIGDITSGIIRFTAALSNFFGALALGVKDQRAALEDFAARLAPRASEELTVLGRAATEYRQALQRVIEIQNQIDFKPELEGVLTPDLIEAQAEVARLATEYDALLDLLERGVDLGNQAARAISKGVEEQTRLIKSTKAAFDIAPTLEALERLRAWRTSLVETAKQTRKLSRESEELGFTFSSALEDAIVAGRQLREILKGLAQDIARIFVRKTISEPFGNFLADAFSGLFGGGGSPAKGPLGPKTGGPFGQASGGLQAPAVTIAVSQEIAIQGGADTGTVESLRLAGTAIVDEAVAKIRQLEARNDLFPRRS